MKNRTGWNLLTIVLLVPVIALSVLGKPGNGKGKSGESTPLETDHFSTGQIDGDGPDKYTNGDAGVSIALDRGRYEFTMQCSESSPCTRTFSLNIQPTAGGNACDPGDPGVGVFDPARLSLFIEDLGDVTGSAVTTARGQFRELDCDLSGNCFSTGNLYTLTWDTVAVDAEPDGSWTAISVSAALVQLGSKKRASRCEVSADFALNTRPAP